MSKTKDDKSSKMFAQFSCVSGWVLLEAWKHQSRRLSPSTKRPFSWWSLRRTQQRVCRVVFSMVSPCFSCFDMWCFLVDTGVKDFEERSDDENVENHALPELADVHAERVRCTLALQSWDIMSKSFRSHFDISVHILGCFGKNWCVHIISSHHVSE